MALFSFAGIALISLGFYSTQKISEDQFIKIRKDQIADKELSSGLPLELERISGVILNDYFSSVDNKFLYLGGLTGTDLIPGEEYDHQKVKHTVKIENTPTFSKREFLTERIGKEGLYINIDQGKTEVVRRYLQSMDEFQESYFDKIYVDFRFIREIDFSQLIALFNQLSPPEKILIGEIKDGYRKTRIESGGKPFFSAGEYVFLINTYSPESLRKLVQSISGRNGYRVLGDPGILQDTVCVYSDFSIAGKDYRVCTERFSIDNQTDKILHTELIDMENWTASFMKMDQYFYQNQDTNFVVQQLPGWLKEIDEQG